MQEKDSVKDSFVIRQELGFWEYYRIFLRVCTQLKSIRVLVLFVLAVGMLGPLLVSMGGRMQNGPSILLEGFLPALAMVAFFLVAGFIISAIIYKTRPHLFKNVSYEFTHWGITRNGEKTIFSKPWREITRAKETKSFFIFNIGQLDLHFIQKKMLTDAAELAAFRAFVHDRMQR